MTTEKDKASPTCGKAENEFCSNSFHLSNDKTAEEILVQHSPNPKGGYRGSWIINAMQDYSTQQLKEYREKLKSRIIFWNSTNTEDEPRYSYKDILELIDQTDSTK